MNNESTNLPNKTEEQEDPNYSKSDMEYMGRDFIESLVENFLPMIEPHLKPAKKKLDEFLGEDENWVLLRRPKGQDTKVYIFDASKIESFKHNKAIKKTHDVEEFLQLLLTGRLGELFDKFSD